MAENYVTKQSDKGSVNISEDVISALVTAAVTDTDGIAGFENSTIPELADIFGRKNSKGIKIQFIEDKITIDVQVTVQFGRSITETAARLQEGICREVESVTGLGVVVNVHVTGIAFEG